jgi:TP901 family phage tail tape measure protein
MAGQKVMQLGIEVTLDGRGAITGIKNVESATVKAGASATRASSGFGKLNTMLGALGITMGVAGLTRIITGTTKAFSEFEQQIKNVQNITEVSDSTIGGMADQIRALPPALGTATELTKGLYQTLSSGVPKDNALEFMRVNAMAAKGNLADLTQTISASTSILAAFNLPASEATAVLDSMTKTVDLGKLTFSDLANNIGKSASIAAAAGVSYNELFAASAQLTLGGLSVEEAMTGIRAIMTASISPTEQQTEAMQKYGVELSANAIQQQGFVGYMKSISAAVGDNVEAMAELFPNVRAIGPALALVREEGDQFDDILRQIEESGGKVERNFERMANSLPGKIDQMSVAWDSMKITIGEELAPAALDFANLMIDFLPKVANAISFVIEQMKYLGEAIEYIVTLGAGMATVLAADKLMAVSAAAQAAGESFTIMGGGLAYLQMTAAPLLLTVTALTAATLGAIKVYDMLADQMRENAEIDMSETMRWNDKENALQKAVGAYNLVRESQGLSRLSMEEYAATIGATADAEGNLLNGIKNRLVQMKVSGELTEDNARILDAYFGKVSDVADAEGDAATATDKANSAFAEQAKKAAAAKRAVSLLDDAVQTLIDLQEQAGKWVEDQSDTWDTFYKNVSEGGAEWMFGLKELLDAGAITFDEFADAVGEAGDDLFRQQLIDAGAEFVDETVDNVNQLERDINEILGGIDPELPPIDVTIPRKSIFDGIVGGLSDALGRGFNGEWNSFMDLWDSLWKDAAKSMTGIIGDGLASLLNGQDAQGNAFGIGDFFKNIQNNAGIGSTIGGIGMVLQGRQQGGAQGALQGAMGGMMAGAIAGPIGMAVGAIAGGLISYFGGKEKPRTGVAVGHSGVAFSSTEMNTREEEEFMGKIRTLYDSMEAAYRGIFLQFEDAGLGKMLRRGGHLPTVDTGGGVENMTPEDMMNWLSSEALPQAFEEYYKPVFEQGLSDLGVNNATIDALFDKLPDLSGDARIRLLSDFVGTVVQLSHSMEMANWDDFRDATTKDSLRNFVDGVGDVTDQMDLMMDSWRGMDLEDVVREVGAIGDAFDQALQGVAEMMGQIDNMRTSIQQGWAGMQENLALSMMGDAEQIQYFQDQIADWMGQLANATSLEGIDEANSNLMNYVGELQRVVDPMALMGDGSGRTWGDYLSELMAQASGTAQVALDAVEDVVQDAYDSLVERLNAASEALLNFEDAVTGTDNAGTGGVTGGADTGVDREIMVQNEVNVAMNINVDGTPIYNNVRQFLYEWSQQFAEGARGEGAIS